MHSGSSSCVFIARQCDIMRHAFQRDTWLKGSSTTADTAAISFGKQICDCKLNMKASEACSRSHHAASKLPTALLTKPHMPHEQNLLCL